MNFLAHIFLSGSQADVMAGNFMADSVKGNRAEVLFSEGIREGIRMHRAIDTFTDGHPVVGRSKERLRKQFGKYAPVVADVYYDHFLAVEWNAFSAQSLRSYVNSVYIQLKEYYSLFPARTQRFYDYMLQYDILFAYQGIEGIDRAMRGMARRARFESGMERAAGELRAHYAEYRAEFMSFFPQLQEHIRTFKQ